MALFDESGRLLGTRRGGVRDELEAATVAPQLARWVDGLLRASKDDRRPMRACQRTAGDARCTSGKPMTATRKDTAAAIAANRFGLGARPGELATVARDPQDWLVRQLKGSPPVLAGEGLKPSSETLAKVIELRKEVAERAARKEEGWRERR